MFLIDGYNLLHQTEMERDELIDKLESFLGYKKKTALIIFDGFNGSSNCEHRNRMEIRYVGNADAEIIYQMEKNQNPNYLILVSSDNELIDKAQERRIKFIRSQDFNFIVPKQIKNTDDEKEKELSDKEAREWLSFFDSQKPDK